MQHLAEFFEQGGFFMYVNLVCSTVTIAIIVERTIFFLGKGSVNAKAFLEQIRKLVAANNVDRAIKLCSATEAPVARVAKAGLTRLPKGEAAVTTAIEETLVDVTPELKKRIGAFAAVAKAAAADRSTILSAKISEAMNNTWLGLAIAVTCMIGHVFLNAASKKQQHELEAFSMKLENLLAESTSHATQARG